MTVDAALDELEEVWTVDNWAESIVQSMAFRHIARSPSCRGWTTFTAGRVFCGECGWALSGRLDDAGSERSARFAIAALATIGSAVAWALPTAPVTT